MKILRSLNRRGNSVTSAGYFTVLQSIRWSAASRIERESHPDSPHSSTQISEEAGLPFSPNPADSQEGTIHLRFVDPEARDRHLLYDSPALRGFAGVDLGRAAAPDESTILNFRHLLEAHDLCGKILDTVNFYLDRKGIRIATGTIVDATIIAAPSSTKNSKKERDPEMHQTKKGNQYYFGAKAHIGVDSKSGIIHSVCTSAASVSDVHMLPDLLHGEEKKVWGDAGYQGQTEAIHEAAPQAQDMTCRRVKTKQGVDENEKRRNRTKSRVRAKVEWPFRILKRVFGYTKVRYRGIKKNHEWLLTAFALVNLYQHRKRLTPQLAPLGA